MVDRRIPFSIAAAMFVWSAMSADVGAFEREAPVLAQPPAASQDGVKKSAPPVVTDLHSKATETDKSEKRGIKVPGLGSVQLPKFNFGLDLMYGNSEAETDSLSFTNDPLVEGTDLSIMGTVKKKF